MTAGGAGASAPQSGGPRPTDCAGAGGGLWGIFARRHERRVDAAQGSSRQPSRHSLLPRRRLHERQPRLFARAASKLAHVTGYDVLSFEYRLAPEPYPLPPSRTRCARGIISCCSATVRGMSCSQATVRAATLRSCCAIVSSGGPPPARALILMSPWTDMTMSGASYAERAEIDPMLTPEYIEAVASPTPRGRTTPRPTYPRCLPTLPASRRRSFRSATMRSCIPIPRSLYQAMKRANVPLPLAGQRGMWHVFQMFPDEKGFDRDG